MPKSNDVTEYASYHCAGRPSHFPRTGRLLSPQPNGLRDATTVAAAVTLDKGKLGEPSSPRPSRKKPANTRLVNPPTLPPKKSMQVRSQTPPGGGQAASVPSPATARHYVVVDTVGNCAVVDAKPADGLKIVGDKDGYTSSESADTALKDAGAECKGLVETESDSSSRQPKQKQRRLVSTNSPERTSKV